ncbi:MAG: tRNA (guanosine(46)-N7)-methyltransferase TrmB [Bacteroidota bacterium]
MARRKELKKAAYKEFPNCFSRDNQMAGQWHTYFKNDHPLTFELGCGKAEFSLELARRYPKHNFVGVDLKMDRMWYAAKEALETGLTNIAFICLNLNQIDEYVGENEADSLWITFPDPFPKKRQAKHRMINPPFLKRYARILKDGQMLNFKTDNRDLFHYSLEVFVREGNIRFHQLTFDLHEDERFDKDVKILTTYERDFLAMGKPTHYVQLSFLR